MQSTIIRYPRKGDPERLYSPREVAEMLSIGYDTAKYLCRTHGIKIRARSYINRTQLDGALKSMSAKEAT